MPIVFADEEKILCFRPMFSPAPLSFFAKQTGKEEICCYSIERKKNVSLLPGETCFQFFSN